MTEPRCVPHTELPHTSRLFSDFLYRFDRVARFYDYAPRDPASIRAAATRIDYPAERRAALVAALREQNGDSPALDLLSRADTVAVVTGQQVGLFSGPCYSVYKALTASRLARRLRESGVPAVAVFWLATEDHDFAEISHCWVFDTARQPVRLEIPATNSEPRPVGGIRIESAPTDELRRLFGEFAYGEEVAAAVGEAYAPGETLGSAFSRLFKRLLAPEDLIHVDPLSPAIRRIAAPFLAQAVRASGDITARLLERNRELTDAGYHAQVHVEEQSSLIFLLDSGRRLGLARQNGQFAAAGRRYSPEELAGRAEELSPNALLRPVMQDYILPTVAYIGGPAEMAYFAQSQVIYHLLLGRMPVARPRWGATLLDARAAKLIDRHQLTLADFLHGEEALREKIAAGLVPPDLARRLEETRADAGRLLDALGASLSSFDVTLEEAFGRSRRKIAYQLEKTSRKTAREALRRNQRAAADAAYLSGLVFPHKHLQERLYSILPFVAAHGWDLIDRVASRAALECPDHQLLVV